MPAYELIESVGEGREEVGRDCFVTFTGSFVSKGGKGGDRLLGSCVSCESGLFGCVSETQQRDNPKPTLPCCSCSQSASSAAPA